MKDLPIKFRVTGIDADGDEETFCLEVELTDFKAGYILIMESAAQLCGYDIDGNEIYEGDILFDSHGAEYTAALKGFGFGDDDVVSLYVDDKTIPYLRLKGGD